MITTIKMIIKRKGSDTLNKNGKEIGETIFIIIYLLFIVISSFLLAFKNNYYILIMTLLLGIGDSFHLIPRLIKNIKGNFINSEFYLGLGTQISSITMTLFYLLLIYFFEIYSIDGSTPYTSVIPIFKDMTNALFQDFSIGTIGVLLVIIRIIICLLPYNNWYNKEGNKEMSIIRNIPFLLIGIIALYFAFQNSFTYLGILVFLSFLFYMPVALFAKRNKKLGILMIPKTICYIMLILNLIIHF